MIKRGPITEKPNRALLRLLDVKPGEPMPVTGDRIILKNRTTGDIVEGRFIKHEYLDKCTVLPDIRIDMEGDWVVYKK